MGALSTSAGSGRQHIPGPCCHPCTVGRHLPGCVPGYCTPPVPHAVGCTEHHGGVEWENTHGITCGCGTAALAVAQGIPQASTWPQQKWTPLYITPRLHCSHLLTETRLLTAQSPHSSSGKVKAKKAQVEERRWLQGLEGDGPSTMSPPCTSPGYLHVE